MIIPIGIFAAVLAVILIPYFLLVAAPDGREDRVIRKRVKSALARAQVTRENIVREEERLSSVPVIDAALRRVRHLLVPLQQLLDQSGLRMNLGTMLIASATCAAASIFLAFQFFRSPLAAATTGLLGTLLPWSGVRQVRARRLWRFEEQFPEAIDLLSRSLRAGHAFAAGLALAAEELPAPTGSEFRLLYDRQNFGMPIGEALKDFARRVPTLDAQFFVTAVLTQREAGGNLAEVLDNLAGVVRERFKVKRQVRVISAHGRITGWVLAGMAPCLAAAFLVVSPGHLRILLNDPLGIKMITVAATLQVIGALAIRRLVRIEY